MEQNRKPRHKPMHLWKSYFDKGDKNIQWRKDNPLITSGAGKTGQPPVKE